jgi:myo-inositol-1(or 4)-monophosphatase
MSETSHLNQADLDLILEAAKHAAAIAMSFFAKAPEITIKGDASPVTEADLAIDAYLHDVLRAARIDYGWLSEEREDDGSRHHAARSFVVDPIDGTRAFIAETAEWCISIGIIEAGRPVVGVLYCPVSNVIYTASKGQGAFRNGLRLEIVQPKLGAELRMAGPKPLIRALQEQNGPAMKSMPYVPSLALRLAMVADGGLDATLVKPKSAFWDIAAADVILEEAGGQLVNVDGSPVDYAAASPKLGTMLAAKGNQIEPILKVVRTLSMG